MTLRIAAEKNAARLAPLGYATFDQAFREMNNQEDFDAYLAHAFSLESVSEELKDSRAEFFVALEGDEPVGYFKLFAGMAPACVTPVPAIELARFYTLKSQWGKGVGALMMEEALAVAQKRKWVAMWLSSWKKNHRGNAFYRKWGFDVAGEKTFTIGKDVQEDFVLTRPL
jgi:GNAT superfamily N-acetyltransferase